MTALEQIEFFIYGLIGRFEHLERACIGGGITSKSGGEHEEQVQELNKTAEKYLNGLKEEGKSKEPEVKNEPLGKIKAILARTYTGEVKFNLVAQHCERGEALREIREIIKQTEDNK